MVSSKTLHLHEDFSVPLDGSAASWAAAAKRRAFAAVGVLVCALVMAVVCASQARAGNQTYYYDPSGRLTAVVDATNGSAQYSYDANGNILSVVRAAIGTLFVAEVSPSTAASGTTVTIGGTGFGTTSNTSVTFNGVSATPSAVTSTSITVTVPSGATTGSVVVTTPAGSASATFPFTVRAAVPTISSVPSGIVVSGTTISINGTGFDPTPANDIVLINGVHAQVTSASATLLSVVVPVVVSNNPVVVSTPSGVATSAGMLVVAPNQTPASLVQSVMSSALGSAPTLTFDGSNRDVMVSFSATQGQALTWLVASAASGLNGGTAQLYAPSGSEVAYGVNLVSGANPGPVQAPVTGTYVLWVFPPLGGSGSTTIDLVALPPPATATITAGAGPVTVSSSTPGQGFDLTFTGTAGSIISVNIVINSPGSTTYGQNGDILRITGPAGQIYSDALFYFHNYAGEFTGPLGLPSGGTGTYTISYVPAYGETGSITFTLYAVPAPASAALTANGSATPLTTTVPGQAFAPTFVGTAGQTYSLTALVSSGTLGAGDAITIKGATDGLQIYSGVMNSSSLFTGAMTIPAGETQTYTVIDTPAGMDTGQLTLTLYNFAPSVTASLTVNDVLNTLTTTAPGQIFAPTFTATAGERFTLDVNVQSGSLAAGAVTITGPGGTLYTGSSNSSELFTGLVVIPSGGAGTYTITDTQSGTQTGGLGFTLQNVPANPTASISIGGSPVNLTTTTPGQSMVLSFSGTAGQSVSVLANTYTGTFVSNSGANLFIIETDGVTQLYGGNVASNQSSALSSNVVLPTTGTYTIWFTGAGKGTGGATFTLYNEAAKTSTLTAASGSTGGGSVGVTTTIPDDPMALQMAETSGHRVALLVQVGTGLSGNNYVLTVTAPDGATQLFNLTTSQASTFTGAMPIPAAVTSTAPLLTQTGTYAILLTPSPGTPGGLTGTGTFTAYDVPADVTGTVTTGASATNFVLTTPGQGLRATLAGVAGQSATITVTPTSTTPTSLCFNVTVLKPDGVTILIGAQSCSTSYSTGSLTLPTTGNYMVVAIPTVPAIGTFTVGATSP